MTRLEKVIGRHTPRPPISYETYLWLIAERSRLLGELYAMGIDRDRWYMKANYTPEEIDEMRHRATKGLDENGAWLWPDSVRTTR